jgi:hypothetical protein
VFEQLPVAVHLSRNFDYHPGSLHVDDVEDSFERSAMIILHGFKKAWLHGDKKIGVTRAPAEVVKHVHCAAQPVKTYQWGVSFPEREDFRI